MDKQEMTIAEFLQSIELRQRNIETLLLSQKTILNFDEVAIYTGLSKSYLYKLTCTGGIPCYKPNGKLIFANRIELDKWLLRNRKATNEELDIKASTYVTLKSGGTR
jgi:excisionase family DNA binding protein